MFNKFLDQEFLIQGPVPWAPLSMPKLDQISMQKGKSSLCHPTSSMTAGTRLTRLESEVGVVQGISFLNYTLLFLKIGGVLWGSIHCIGSTRKEERYSANSQFFSHHSWEGAGWGDICAKLWGKCHKPQDLDIQGSWPLSPPSKVLVVP